MKKTFKSLKGKLFGGLTVMLFVLLGSSVYAQTTVELPQAIDRLQAEVDLTLQEIEGYNPANSTFTLDELKVKAKFFKKASREIADLGVATMLNQADNRINVYLASVSPNIDVTASGLQDIKDRFKALLQPDATMN